MSDTGGPSINSKVILLVMLGAALLVALGWRVKIGIDLGILEFELEPPSTPTISTTSSPAPPPQDVDTPTSSDSQELQITGYDTPEPRSEVLIEAETLDLEIMSVRNPASQAIRDYYALIVQRDYDTALASLTDHYKDKMLCCTADGQYDRVRYEVWWDSVARIDIHSMKLVEETSTHAQLIVDISYVAYYGRVYNDIMRVELIRDIDSQKWMFYDTESLSTR